MKSLMIHGCYDVKTLKTLESFGHHELVFDLRAKSPNLIPFHHLKEILKSVMAPQVFLSFADDKKETIESALSILKDAPQTLIPLFRDQRPANFYYELDRAFFWMFHPEGDWRSILTLPGIRGILLPLKWQESYEAESDLWNLIEARNLETYLHAESFDEALAIDTHTGAKVSIDLTTEVEVGFRTVDQEKLKRMKIWRKLNESSLS